MYSQKAAAIEYFGVEPMIRKLVNGFSRVADGRVDLESAANLAYAKAYLTYRPEAGAFTTWVWWQVWGALADAVRRQRTDKSIDAKLTDDGEQTPMAERIPAPEPSAEFDRKEFASGLSADGKVLMRAVLDTPGELRAIIGQTPGATRITIRRWLRDTMGWAAGEIREAFTELRDVLTPRRRSGWSRFWGGVCDELGIKENQ